VNERRAVIIGVMVAALLVAGVVDRVTRPDASGAVVVATSPAARPVSAGASTWYCPIGAAGGGTEGSIVIQNIRSEPVEGVLTLYPQSGPPVAVGLSIPARDRRIARESEFIRSPMVGAVVELERGGMAVEQTVTSGAGESTTPCASATADHWYVADGSTALNNAMILNLFNPFPDDAIVDMDFATDQGRTAPGAFQGVVVPARSVLGVNVGEHVRRREHVATTITARRGRIVAGRLQLRTSPRNGFLVALAASAPSSFWDFPSGVVSESIGERFHLYNPGRKDAAVQIGLTLDQGAAEPLDVKVPAGERVTVDPGTEPRVPKGVAHAVTVRSDVPLVAERSLDYAPASGRSGLAGALGATSSARVWLLPQGAVTDAVEEAVAVHNVGRRAARVSIVVVAGGRRQALEGLSDVRVGPGERRAFALREVITGPDLPIVVDATEPVVVERFFGRVGRGGVTFSTGIPVGG
jgi:hypothetical protein